MQPPKILWQFSCSANTQKLTCGSSFCNIKGCKSQISIELGYTRKIYHEDTIYNTIISPWICLKSLKKTNLQKSTFHNKEKIPGMFSLAYNLPKTMSNFRPSKFRRKKYVQTKWIFRPSKLRQKSKQKHRGYFDKINYIEKSTWKKRGFFFDHRNYIEKSTWKQRGFFGHRNYVEESTWKQIGFLAQRKYIKKVCGNDVEIRRNLVFEVLT